MLVTFAMLGVSGQQPVADVAPVKPDPNAISDARAAIGEANLLSIRYAGTGKMVMGAPDALPADRDLE